jgi:hypothetical protein
VDLGAVSAGTHSLRFATDGQLNGIADLGKFILTLEPVVDPMHFLRLSDDEFLEKSDPSLCAEAPPTGNMPRNRMTAQYERYCRSSRRP